MDRNERSREGNAIRASLSRDLNGRVEAHEIKRGNSSILRNPFA